MATDNTQRHTNNDYLSRTPTLIVGLGGLGSSIAQSVFAGLSDEHREYVGVHVMDTDVQELADSRYQALANQKWLTQTSGKGTLRDCVERLGQQTDQVLQWFPSATYALNGYKLLNKGAAQVRAISRLALVDTFHSGRIDALQAALNRLTRLRADTLEPAARVILVNSLAGGTGSGAFIQVALYIRAYLESQGAGGNVSVRAFVAMPEIFIRNGDYGGQDLQLNVKANGYAALKELDGCMRVRSGYFDEPSRKDMAPLYSLNLEYKPGNQQAVAVGAGPLPFDVVTLFEFTGADGSNLGSKAAYIAQMQDAIRFHLFSPLEGRGGIESQTDNLANTHVRTGDRSRYAGSGSASVEYPVEDMVAYVAKRWATDGISLAWLELDRLISDEIRHIEDEKKNGNFLELPDAHDRLGQMLRDQAESIRPTPFYRQVYDDAHELDDKGQRIEAKHQVWLDQVEQRLKETVNGALAEKRPLLQMADESVLVDPANTASTVRACEDGLLQFRQEVRQRVQPIGRSTAKNLLWKPYTDGVAVNKNDPTQLNTWLLASPRPLHPLAIRYVLVESRAVLRQRIGELREQVRKAEKQVENYTRSWDDPGTDIVETAADMAVRAAGKPLARLRRITHDFAVDYVARSESQLRAIEKLAHASVQLECYEVLYGTLEDMADQWRSWFLELETLVERLRRETQALAVQHERSPDRTRRYVLASEVLKSEKWTELMPELAGELMPPEVSQEMYLAAYRAKGRQYCDGLPPSMGGTTMASVFSGSVLIWCSKKLRHHPALDLNVGEAIIQEQALEQRLGLRALDDKPIDALVRYLRELESLATPWVQAGDKGQPFAFTCVHPDVLKVWSDRELATALPSPFSHRGFSPYCITRMSLLYALCADQLLTMKDPNALYRAAYEQRIAAARRLPAESSTPHLDFRWDSPAFLPEFDDAVQTQAMHDLHHAVLLNLALAQQQGGRPKVFAQTYDLADLWHWSPVPGHQVPAPGPMGRSVPATTYGLVDVFAMHYGWVQPLLAQERERQVRERVRPEQAPLIAQLDTLLRSLSDVPQQAPTNEQGLDRQKRLLGALFKEVLNIQSLAFGTPVAALNRAHEVLKVALDRLDPTGIDADYSQRVRRTLDEFVAAQTP